MKKMLFSLLLTSFLGVGCLDVGIRQNFAPPPARPVPVYEQPESPVVFPLDATIVGYSVSYKGFGEYFQDRFTGYHVGEDIEVPPEDLGPGEIQEVPIQSIAVGTVVFVDWVPGYGGLLLIRHTINTETITSLYGHMDLASITVAVGDLVERGQFLGNLGEGNTKEADFERQHLHFALYKGDFLKKNGYERKAIDVKTWINPTDFFQMFDLNVTDYLSDIYSSLDVPSAAKKLFPIDFFIPRDWDVEYISSIKALNLYTRTGDGSARERSQIFIRFFDADQFLTLPTVQIHSTEDQAVGAKKYVARRYDIEKKSNVPNFADQPLWRNTRHTVTDFRSTEGKTRYYVIAANPELDPEIYERILTSMEIN